MSPFLGPIPFRKTISMKKFSGFIFWKYAFCYYKIDEWVIPKYMFKLAEISVVDFKAEVP